MSAVLRRISPAVECLASINRGNISKYPEVDYVLKCHSRAADYLVQIFKQPLQAPCCCAACKHGLWKPFMLKPELAGSLPTDWQVPLPSPLPEEVGEALHYMPLDQAMQCTFSDEHQPSKVARLQRRGPATARSAARPRAQPHPRAQDIVGQDTGNKLVSRQLARGVVQCKDCLKPRLVYSATAPNRMVPPVVEGVTPTNEQIKDCQDMAQQVLQDCLTSSTYICGAPILDEEHPFHGVFVTQMTLGCHDAVEPYYYSTTPSRLGEFSQTLCCFCACQDATVDDELCSLFRTVLPVCEECISQGALIPVRYATRNSAARSARAAVAAERRARRSEAAATGSNSEAPTPSRRRGRGRGYRGRGRGRGRSN